jgi:pimeloyl-ACP methyl ester carboxylesterase
MKRFALGFAVLTAFAAATPAFCSEVEVSIDSGKGGSLYGSLQTPNGPAQDVAVLLLPGAGPTDRDGNAPTLGLRPQTIKLIADALAAHGFSSLRIDKRLIGKSASAGPASETELRFDDYIHDAVSWVAFLRHQPGVHCVVILGHSEGALIAAAAAHLTPVCGVISLAGVGRLFPATLHAQLKASGASDGVLADVDHTVSELQAGREVPNAPPMLRASIQPYLISQLRYDPVATLAIVRAPVLIEQGTNDLQVPQDARPPDSQFVRLRAGNHGVETDAATTIASEAAFDTAYAVRSIADLVPNAFTAWSIVDALLGALRGQGWDDALIGRLSAFIVAELRRDLTTERDVQAAGLFADAMDEGAIHFGLRGGEGDWLAPAEIWTTLPLNAQQLSASNGGPLERSLFLPIYAAELNDEERTFAVYLDRDDAVRWWHRNGTTARSYALRGWRRGNVYPDFLFAALHEGERDRIVVIETKGEQLAGNPDTEYKRALLSLLSEKFDPTPLQTGSLDVADEAFDFSAAVVLFGELDAKLPAIIRGAPAA